MLYVLKRINKNTELIEIVGIYDSYEKLLGVEIKLFKNTHDTNVKYESEEFILNHTYYL